MSLFDRDHFRRYNAARLKHLATLNLPLEGKRVLDLGCGPGDLAQFFVERGCDVVCIDARQENIDKLQRQYPGLTAHVADVETASLEEFGTFDIVFCYGLLYHLENPIAALRKMRAVCTSLLLLETIVCDHRLPVLRLVREPALPTQSLHRIGGRPSPSYVVNALIHVGFPFVYMPRVMPEHPDFHYERQDTLGWRRGEWMFRSIFAASIHQIENVTLLGQGGHTA